MASESSANHASTYAALMPLLSWPAKSAPTTNCPKTFRMRSRHNVASIPYLYDVIQVIALIDEILQRILSPLACLPATIDYVFENHVQSRAGVIASEKRRTRKPRKHDRQISATALDHFKVVECLVEQCTVLRNVVTTDGAHGQLKDDSKDTFKRVGSAARTGGKLIETSLNVGCQCRKICIRSVMYFHAGIICFHSRELHFWQSSHASPCAPGFY